ncbi:hypothetical protein [Micromonospora matsumotoense]|uniref:hypothetical protein n=1 Tax=Micromonospora matsumotoense TaxID=121616 RepID=UPI0033DD7D52
MRQFGSLSVTWLRAKSHDALAAGADGAGLRLVDPGAETRIEQILTGLDRPRTDGLSG